MAAPYAPAVGMPFGVHTDHQGFESRRTTLWNITASLSTSYGATPPDGAIGYRTDVVATQQSATRAATKKHIVYFDSADNTDISVPRTDCDETWIGVPAFNRTGSNPPFTCNQTLPSVGSTATMVTNLNANYLKGYLTDATATANTVGLRDSSGRMTGADPVGDTDLVNLRFMRAELRNADDKGSVRCSTIVSLPSGTFSSNVWTASANGAFAAQDGVTLVLNDLIAVMYEGGAGNQYYLGTANTLNGLYKLTQLGDASNPAKLTRAVNADVSSEVTAGMFFFISEGTNQGNSKWALFTDDPIYLRTDAPDGLSAVAASGGSLTAGTYYYRIAFVDYNGNEAATTLEVSGTTSGANLTLNLSWTSYSEASSYRIYRSTTSGSYGATSLAGTTTGTTFSDTSASLTSGQPKTASTLQFAKIGSNAFYSGGNGIDISGSTISVKISASTTYTANRVLFNGSTTTIDGSANLTYVTPALSIGATGSSTGQLKLVGTTSGTVTTTVAAAAGTWTFTLPTTGGTNTYALTTDGSGTSSWSQIGLTTAVTGVLPIANGGTNNSSTYTAGSVIFSDGSKLTQSNANFFWDNTNNRLGIGIITPSGQLHIKSSGTNVASNIYLEGGHGWRIVSDASTSPEFLANSLAIRNPSSGVTAMVISSAGNIGIGTTNPGELLHVYKGQNASTRVFVQNDTAGAAALAGIVLGTNESANAGTIVSTGSSYNTATTQAHDPINVANAFNVIGARTGGMNLIGANGPIRLYAGNATTERVRFASDGNVGIGTTGPTTTVDVAATARSGASGLDQGWFQSRAQTYTDNATAASGTATQFAFHSIFRPTLAATNASVTTTDAATWYIANSPAAGTNMTLTRAWALWVDDGNARFDGNFALGSLTATQARMVVLDSGTVVTPIGSTVALFQASSAGSTSAYLNIISGTSGGTGIYFGDTSANGQGYIVYDNSADTLDLGANTSLALRCLSTAGYVQIVNRLCIGSNDPGATIDLRGNSLGVTPSDTVGLLITNTTAAAAGAQQISPSTRWHGSGWKTDAPAASQTVDFRSYIVPVQGAAAPTAYLTFERSINGAAYVELFRFNSTALTASTILVTDANKAIVSGAAIPSGATAARVFATDVTGASGGAVTITHNLGTKDVLVQVYYKGSDGTYTDQTWFTIVERTSTNAVKLTWGFTPANSVFRVVVVG